MKKIFKIVSLCFLLISCNDSETNNKINNLEKQATKSIFKVENVDYTGQLPYIETHEDTDFNQINEKLNINDILKNKADDWSVLDSKFNEKLTSFESEYLSYLILSKKDLIKDYKFDNSNNTKDKFMFHLNNLIEHENVGYCLLYNGLMCLKNTNPDYVKTKAQIIVNYSKDDKFHSEYINDKMIENDPVMEKYYKKIKDNYSYLDKIKKLAK